MSSHSGTIGRKRDYYFGGEQIRRQRSAEWHSRHGYSSSEEEYQNNPQNTVGAFDTQLLASLLIQSQQLANIDRSYRSDCDNEEVTESLLTEYPQSYHTAGIGSPHSAAKNSRNPFSLKYEIHPPTDPDRVSFTGSIAGFDRLQAAEMSASGSTYLQANNLALNPNNTVRSSRSKNGRLNRVSGMTSSSSATSSNSNPAGRERQKLHQQQQQLQKELKEASNLENYTDSDKTIFEPPPDPAPPEIPPRTQSLLLSMRKRSDYQLKFEENGDQKHEEFIPQSQQKDYLMAAENSRSSEFPSKNETQSQQGCN